MDEPIKDKIPANTLCVYVNEGAGRFVSIKSNLFYIINLVKIQSVKYQLKFCCNIKHVKDVQKSSGGNLPTIISFNIFVC